MVKITDKDLRENDSRLVHFYQNNPKKYQQICGYYGVTPSVLTNTTKARFDALQTKLVSNYINMINDKSANKTLVFIIHGFNCHPLLPIENGVHKGSFDQFKVTRESLNEQFPNRRFLFVEVYWDGLNADNGSQQTVRATINSIHFWPHAQANATYAGLELRRILSRINTTDINVITHSHGAGVITTALFNTKKFDREHNSRHSLYDNENKWEYDINEEYKNDLYKTPTQNFYVGMLAPAIPGKAIFSDYHQRTIDGKDADSPLMNYHFVVGFNSEDEVTTKKGFFIKYFGSTSLACQQTEYDSTAHLFNYNKSIMDSIDFTRYDKRDSVQIEHAWLTYLKHKPQIGRFFKLIIKK